MMHNNVRVLGTSVNPLGSVRTFKAEPVVRPASVLRRPCRDIFGPLKAMFDRVKKAGKPGMTSETVFEANEAQDKIPVSTFSEAEPAEEAVQAEPISRREKRPGLLASLKARFRPQGIDRSTEEAEVEPRTKQGWLRWLFLTVAVIAVGIIWFVINPETPKTSALTIAGPKGADFRITFLELAFAASILFGFFEAIDRRDPLLLDWWLPYVVWGASIYIGTVKNPTLWQGAIFLVPLGMLLIATLWNRAEELDTSWWDRFDTTGLFALCFALVITKMAQWPGIPYPAFIPIGLVYLIGGFALLKELMRSPQAFLFGVGVILMGAVAGFYMKWATIVITFGLTIAAVFIAARQEWIPIAGPRRTDMNVSALGKFNFRLIKAWDIMFAWWTSFVLVGLAFHQNFSLLIFHS
jgi:hypothetical protein